MKKNIFICFVVLISFLSIASAKETPNTNIKVEKYDFLSNLPTYKNLKFKTFKANEKEGQVWVTFDSGDKLNILDSLMQSELNKLAEVLEQDSNIKVVVFQSSQPNVFIVHAGPGSFKLEKEFPKSRDETKLFNLQIVLNRISNLPQVTITKIEGFARGGGHEFALACDMRFAAREKAIFMQMEVGVGFLPFGGGTARMARQVGVGRALEILLSAKDFGADEAERLGTINKALDASDIDQHVLNLANRISMFPAAAIKAVKKSVYASIDLPIEEALQEEAFQLYQSLPVQPALKRVKYLQKLGIRNNMKLQQNWESVVTELQKIK